MRLRRKKNGETEDSFKNIREWLSTILVLIDIIVTLVLGVLVYNLTNKQTQLMDSQTTLMNKQNEITEQQFKIDSTYNVIYSELYNQQNKFLEQQTKLAEQELNIGIESRKIQGEIDWTNFKNATMDLYGDIIVFMGRHWRERFRRDSTEDIFNENEIKQIKQFEISLYELETNAVLIQNESCIKNWRNAIDTTKILDELIINYYPATYGNFNLINHILSAISFDLMCVMDEIIIRKRFDSPFRNNKE